jgi:hypothetical protein
MNIKNIADERARINAYKHSVGCKDLFNGHKYKEDCEWLTLAYLAEILSSTGWPAPRYAAKLNGKREPDFQTYITPEKPFKLVEVTEVLRPGYSRGAFYRALAASGRKTYPIPPPHPQPWLSFAKVLKDKIGKSYSRASWLVIYHDMGYSEFQDGRLWPERMLSTLRTWTHDSDTTCDITRSQYENIFVVDSSGKFVIRLYPHWDVIRER